jgi:ribonuclease HII
LSLPQKSIIKGDEISHTISCASIVAKVYRDRLCLEWDKQYPGYNVKKHKGYGTKEHRESILSLGPTPIHRMTFLRNIIK